MKKTLLLALTLMLLTVSFSQRGGHGGGHFGGFSRSFASQPRIPMVATPHVNTTVQANVFRRGFFSREAYIPYSHRGVSFFYNRGYFYDPYYNWFYPPIGFALGVLPIGYYSFMWSGMPYYYFGGVYYIQNNETKQYEVVSPVLGAIVPELPKETKQITIDGKKCYVTKDNVYYEEYMDGNTLKYKVIGKEN
jgi:hypothetical protein